ncbi:MAG: hypothetical protein KKG33_02685 [candidate division Zixibacteria bacterium]|nr:hypothetical protein [candidate division Zixibacteria bacterium]
MFHQFFCSAFMDVGGIFLFAVMTDSPLWAGAEYSVEVAEDRFVRVGTMNIAKAVERVPPYLSAPRLHGDDRPWACTLDTDFHR